ncbi:MAG: helix-turn-helix transcriptional regulator, partial [Actinomycetota bacterium]
VRAALGAGAGFDAAVLLGQLLWQQGRAEEAERHLESLRPTADSDEKMVLLASVRIEVVDLGLNDFEAALMVAEEAEASIDDVTLRDQITAERARVLGRHGRNRDAVDIVDPLIDRAQGRTLIAACFAAATSMSVTGQFQRAVEATEIGYAAHRVLTGPPEGYAPAIHLALRCLAYLLTGYLSEGEELARAQYAQALSDHSPLTTGFFSLFLGLHAGLQGRCQTTARWGSEGLATFQKIEIPFMQRNALASLALGKAIQGSVDEARRALERLDSLRVAPSDLGGPLVLQARAWTEVAAGDTLRAIELLDEAVELARWSGAKAYESWALHDLARLGRAAEVVQPLQELSRVVEGPFNPARAFHAAALVSGDAAGLEDASKAFEEIGALLVAAEAAADAAVVWRQNGDVRRAAAAELRSGALAALCEGATSPALAAAAPVRAVLTPRELEIARLAASGMSDKEIAKQLFLSHRTVENRLHSVYSKLGVQSRAELEGVLQGP